MPIRGVILADWMLNMSDKGSESPLYDIAVIGLGPAGSFFVRHISEKYKVIVIDKKAPEGEGGFHKPCGGLLAPDAQRSLARFNITLPKEVLVSPQIFSVRTIDVKNDIVRYYQRHYINLDRHKFDQWLISKIPSHIDMHNNAVCATVSPDGDGYRVVYVENSEAREIRAKYLVGADGAASIVRRTLFKDFQIRTYLSIQQWFSDSHDTPFYSCVFDPDLTDSYAWGLTKDNCFLFGGAFSIKTGKQDFDALKKKLLPYGFRLDEPIKTEACLVLRPFGPRNYCYGSKNVFLIGEAAGFVSPSSLEGISYAVDSGYLLSQCFNEARQSPYWGYRRGTRKIRLRLLAKYAKRPFMYHPLMRKMIMKSGLSSISVIT
jgi:flavin-dependent dehydrogenase